MDEKRICYVDHDGVYWDAWLRKETDNGGRLYFKESEGEGEDGNYRKVYRHHVGVPFDAAETPHSWHYPDAE